MSYNSPNVVVPEPAPWTDAMIEEARDDLQAFPRIRYSTYSELRLSWPRITNSTETRIEASKAELQAKWDEEMSAWHYTTTDERTALESIDFTEAFNYPNKRVGGNVMIFGLGSLTDKKVWNDSVRLHVAAYNLFFDFREKRRARWPCQIDLYLDDANYNAIDETFLREKFYRPTGAPGGRVTIHPSSRGRGLQFLRDRGNLVILLGTNNPYRQIIADLLARGTSAYDSYPIAVISRPYEDEHGRDETPDRVRDRWLRPYYQSRTEILPYNPQGLYSRIFLHVRNVDIPGAPKSHATGKAAKAKAKAPRRSNTNPYNLTGR